MNEREVFLRHLAQTSTEPLALEIVKAEGVYLFDRNGKQFLDLVGGISVANTGHRHPRVLEAIRKQLDAYLHIMVYGEFIETPQVQYAQLLTSKLPEKLDTVYFTNSGTEATEGALKLAKRVTNRSQIIAFKNSYHGSTQGALSVMGNEYWKNAFRPLLPDVLLLDHNSTLSLSAISPSTACVIAETIQAEAGILVPEKDWLIALRRKCSETGALLILDEIQTGFGRTGTNWAFEQFDIVPDILLLGKALGGGMPLGAFIASNDHMLNLTHDPELGHITTFGGHPVSCAAGMAAFNILMDEELTKEVGEKESLFRSLLVHRRIVELRSSGLWLAVEFDSFETNRKVVGECIRNGIFVDWFLFASNCMRISPPLTISHHEIEEACRAILTAINSL